MAEPLMNYAVRLARATRDPDSAGAQIESPGSASTRSCVALGASPRASMYLVRAARARALLDGRHFATPHDVKRVARDVLRHPELELAELVQPVWFVPSTKSLESLLQEMISREELLALVVGEFGGTHGLVTLEDVVEEITGDIARQGASPLLRPGEDGRWIMEGRLPLRELEELLDFPPPASDSDHGDSPSRR